jgi:hypothetical protein
MIRIIPITWYQLEEELLSKLKKGADEHTNRLAKKYLGLDKYPYRSQTKRESILKIKPEKVFYQQAPK